MGTSTVTGSVKLIPSGNTGASSFSESSSYPASNGYHDSSSTSNYARFSLSTSTSGYIYYTFDVSEIPSNATITSITAKAKVYRNSRVSNSAVQLYTGTTAKGSAQTFSNTSATVVTISTPGSWTRTELNNLRMRLSGTGSSSSSSKYFYFYGADITINYSYTVTTYDITVTNSSSVTVTANPSEVEAGGSSEIRADSISNITIKDNGTDVTSQFTQRTIQSESYSVETRGTYGFSLNSNNYYQSGNKGVNKSAAVCRINFYVPVSATITFQYINYAEATYDFGVFGNIDVALSTNYYAAGSNGATITDSSYKKACNTSSDNTSSVQTLTYTMSAGEHFIDVKFSKDDASASNNDTLQFKVSITLNEPFTPGTYYGYDISNINADHTILVTAVSVTTLYAKVNGSWITSTSVYKKVSGSWVLQNDLTQVFEDGVNYKTS